MSRCTKQDDGRSTKGCIKDDGHTGRCKVRPDAIQVYEGDAGLTPERPARQAPPPAAAAGESRTVDRLRTVRNRSLGAELAELGVAIAEVGEAVTGLMGDLDVALSAMSGQVIAAKHKAQVTLAALVKSRRQCQQLRSQVEPQNDAAAEAPDSED